MLVALSPGGPATLSCADADGNGRAGLVQIATRMQDTRTNEGVPVILTTLAGHDIDTSGVYAIAAQVGEEHTTRELRIVIVPEVETRQKRRKEGRQKR